MTSSSRSPILISIILLTSATAYALWPLGSAAPSAPESLPDAAPRAPAKPRALDLAAFRAPLWVAPIPPPPPPAPPPPPPPLKLQLIAISSDPAHATFSATIFDPDSNKLLTLSQGQSIDGRTISRISAGSIDLKDARGTRTLALRPDAPASPTGGAP